ncbi:hypothetical protein C8R44DRAFT_737328 [Mycena epipterygia]|nr:hypothetical protein C8R44DRAFT_737328 [Mycena epipterygia]
MSSLAPSASSLAPPCLLWRLRVWFRGASRDPTSRHTHSTPPLAAIQLVHHAPPSADRSWPEPALDLRLILDSTYVGVLVWNTSARRVAARHMYESDQVLFRIDVDGQVEPPSVASLLLAKLLNSCIAMKAPTFLPLAPTRNPLVPGPDPGTPPSRSLREERYLQSIYDSGRSSEGPMKETGSRVIKKQERIGEEEIELAKTEHENQEAPAACTSVRITALQPSFQPSRCQASWQRKRSTAPAIKYGPRSEINKQAERHDRGIHGGEITGEETREGGSQATDGTRRDGEEESPTAWFAGRPPPPTLTINAILANLHTESESLSQICAGSCLPYPIRSHPLTRQEALEYQVGRWRTYRIFWVLDQEDGTSENTKAASTASSDSL